MTGAELAKARKAQGLSQSALARLAGIGRDAVSYWESRSQLDPRGWAVVRVLRALGLPDLPVTRRPHSSWNAMVEAEARALIAMRERNARRLALALSRHRVTCGAITRKGMACRMKSEPGRSRCKFHGGMSTGAKTPEGLARISEAQARRWAAWRAARAERQ